MRRKTFAAAVGGGAAAVALTLTALQTPAGAGERHDDNRSGNTALGLTTAGKLVSFDVNRPDRARTIGAVSGLSGDTSLVGIDYRVQDRALYGVGNSGGVYTVSTSNAAATKVSQLSVALSGTTFGVDFNPAADRLRIVSDTGQNLRHNVNPGGVTVVDTALTIPPATTAATGVTAAAYTNNDLDPNTATTLFDIDTTLDQVALQSPANSGQLSGTGKLGVDAAADAGFDIYSDLRNGTTKSVTGFATLSVGGRYHLYSISLLTGAAQDRGSFPTSTQVSDLAVVLDR